MNLDQAALSVYPKAEKCLREGHQGRKRLVFHTENDDDRYHVMIMHRCTVCDMPNGIYEYADATNKERYYKKLQPLPQLPNEREGKKIEVKYVESSR